MLHTLQLLAQDNSDAVHAGVAVGAIVGGCLFVVVELALIVVIVAGMWKMFVKAGKPGWAAIIPFYNLYVMCEIGGKPGWWLILCLIPIVSIVFTVLVVIGVAKNFGKGVGFILGMIFLPFIFYPILGFGDARYQPFQAPGFPVQV